MDQELNVKVAEKIMGWRWMRRQSEAAAGVPWGKPNRYLSVNPPHGGETPWDGKEDCHIEELFHVIIPNYSGNVADTMKVVEKMRGNGWSFACTLYEGELPYASFCKRTAASSKNAEAATLPEAICLAALKTVSD